MFGKKKAGIEFRGLSASNEKRNAVILFIIEAIVVLVFLAGIVFVLNFLGIISLSGINSTLFGSLPVQEQEDVNTIEVQSSIPGYSLKLKNQEQLLELLESWGVYGKEYRVTYGATGDTNGVPVKTISINLVDVEQGTNAFGRNATDIYSSSLTEISPGRLNINIYIDEKTLSGEYEDFNPSEILRTSLLASLYRIVNPYKDSVESERVNSSLYEQFDSNPLTKVEYFEIEKL